MSRPYWYKQTTDEPLFPDLLWSRPENKRLAGKLLIVGGNVHGFAKPAAAFSEAAKAGVGTVRVILPDSLFKTVSKLFPEAEFAPSTPSGSFNQQSVAELCDLAQWADGVLLAGDLGRNSETAIMLEQFVVKYSGQLTLTHDALDYFINQPDAILHRPETLLVANFGQLQKLSNGQLASPLTSKMDFLHVVDWLHEFTEKYPASIVLPFAETTFVAVAGQVCSTKPGGPHPSPMAARAAVWWLQNPIKTLEALTSSLL